MNIRDTFTSDYEAVQERLTTLPKKLSHAVMVSDGRSIHNYYVYI